MGTYCTSIIFTIVLLCHNYSQSAVQDDCSLLIHENSNANVQAQNESNLAGRPTTFKSFAVSEHNDAMPYIISQPMLNNTFRQKDENEETEAETPTKKAPDLKQLLPLHHEFKCKHREKQSMKPRNLRSSESPLMNHALLAGTVVPVKSSKR